MNLSNISENWPLALPFVVVAVFLVGLARNSYCSSKKKIKLPGVADFNFGAALDELERRKSS